ncbi:MAG: hypothetical protein JWM47_404 [Acidimicrobiales bacterium]|nr:hypothetical protein [Acidimicrobiales bacterium]
MMMLDILTAITWNPGFKGLLTVAVAVAILCGSIALILGTNSGARLGFLLALTGLFGWFLVMGIIWAIYGIGYKGPAPTWKVVDTTQGDPGGSSIEVADSLPLPSELPDPAQERTATPQLIQEFPPEAPKAPTLGDLVTVDASLKGAIDDQVGPWKILETSNKYTGETQSVVGEALGPDHENLFANGPSDYVVLSTFVTGGKTGRTENSIIGRVKYKFTSALEFDNENLYAAVQLQPIIPQETKAGQAPPLPVADPDAPVYTVVLERDRGALRLPSISFTIFSGIVFGVSAFMLHRRDKLSATQRAAVAGAGA